MSRGPGRHQLKIMYILDGNVGPSPLPGGRRWSMSHLAIVLHNVDGHVNRAELRRAVRSLERGGYVEVEREMTLLDADGRFKGHEQNIVQLTPAGEDAMWHRHLALGDAERLRAARRARAEAEAT